MTLPFPPKSNSKTYLCFVCGDSYKSYESFREHIISKHQEGREYVLCKECGAPVRDLKLHYKVKHPWTTAPKDGQSKALIWYDFTGNKRKRDKKKTLFKEGYFVSEKNNFQQLHYRSGLELQMYQLLEEDDRVYKFEIEPKDCAIRYFFEGEYHTYYPDIKVINKNGSINVIEVKPNDQKSLPQNVAKWEAASKYFSHKNWIFSVKTERGINRLRRELASQRKTKDLPNPEQDIPPFDIDPQ